MSKTKIELNSAGIKELLKSKEITTQVNEIASGVANRAGEGFEINSRIGANRAVATVYAATPKAFYSNLKNKTLLKALGGGMR